MAKSDELNAFLGVAAAEPAAPEPEAQPAPVESTPEPAAAPAKPETKPAAAEPDDAAPEQSEDGKIAFQAFERERARRQDWKEKAVRAETERDELRRQLEEAKRAPPAAATPPAPPQPIDPAADPQGFVNRIQGVVLNERLNQSEMMLREKLGDDPVNAIITEFKQASAANPSLIQQLYAQVHPYQWAAKQVDILRAQREIGDDPAAYRARIEAEARAKWDAEHAANGTAQPRVSPAAGMPPSLANARSVAGRAAPAFTGPTPLQDILRR